MKNGKYRGRYTGKNGKRPVNITGGEVRSVNIGLAQGEELPAGVINGAVTRPLLSGAGTSAIHGSEDVRGTVT